LLVSFHLDAADFDAAKAVLKRTIDFVQQLSITIASLHDEPPDATLFELQLVIDQLWLRLAHIHILGVRMPSVIVSNHRKKESERRWFIFRRCYIRDDGMAQMA